MNQANRSGNQPDKKIIKSYLKAIIKPYKKQTNLALILSIGSILIFIVQSYLIAQLFSGWLVNLSNQQPLNTDSLWRILPWLALCFIARPILHYIKETILLTTSINIRHQVRNQVLQSIVHLGQSRHFYGSDGALSSKVLEQVDALDGYISKFYTQAFVAVLTPLLIVMATAFYSPLAAVLMLLTAPLVPVFMILVGSAAADKSREQFQAMSQLSGRFLDLIRGMPTLKRLNATTLASQSIDSASTRYQHRTMSVLKLAFLSGGVLELFASLAIALVALYLGLGLLGILPWAKGEIPVAYQGALFILLLAPEFYAPLRQLGNDYHAKANAEAAVQAFYPILHFAKDNSKTSTEAITKKNTENQNAIDTSSPTLATEFCDDFKRNPPELAVSDFSIISNDRIRLASTNFHIKASNKVAITGESGVGKSSLLSALLGFIAFDGKLTINDTCLTQSQLTQLQTNIGYLAQNPPVLPVSIAENLRLAKQTASDTELQQVLKKVELWELIEQLPNQLNTQLGERGKGLSGGQLQRLSIAQLLLRNNTLWLLDEPCAHLDPETRADIYQLLGKLAMDKTVLLVSHDIAGVEWLDDEIKLAMPTPASKVAQKKGTSVGGMHV